MHGGCVRGLWELLISMRRCGWVLGLQDRTGGDARTTRLVYAGTQLAPERSLSEYEVVCCALPPTLPLRLCVPGRADFLRNLVSHSGLTTVLPQIKPGATIIVLERLHGGMPASAGRVKMPANNRMHSSAALRTTDMWSSVIGAR